MRYLFISGFLLSATFVCFLFVITPFFAYSQESVDTRANLFFSPRTGYFLTDSTFDVSIFVDTDGRDINAVEADIKFPADKLQVVTPSTGESFISIWAAQPTYSNTAGTISFRGGLPSPGINTSSGLISKVTFRVKKAGTANLEFLFSSKILANDGRGTNILHTLERATYTLAPKPPDGPVVFSDTHSNQDIWYNNNNPVIGWKSASGAEEYSYVFDGFTQTIPDNVSDTRDTSVAFENSKDGIRYFHIKARKDGVWGNTSHFLARIDTTPPAEFQPTINILSATISVKKLLSFFTTDSLSGISHYEVAVIEKSELNANTSPVFIEAESPYQLPRVGSGNVRVLVRALDNAGNVREAYIDTQVAPSFGFLIKENKLTVTAFTLLSLVIAWASWHLLFKHKVIKRLIRGKNVLLHVSTVTSKYRTIRVPRISVNTQRHPLRRIRFGHDTVIWTFIVAVVLIALVLVVLIVLSLVLEKVIRVESIPESGQGAGTLQEQTVVKTTVSPPATPIGIVTVLQNSLGFLNVRGGPGTNFKIIKRIFPGESYEVLEQQEDWTKIKFDADNFGWVLNSYIKVQ